MRMWLADSIKCCDLQVIDSQHVSKVCSNLLRRIKIVGRSYRGVVTIATLNTTIFTAMLDCARPSAARPGLGMVD